MVKCTKYASKKSCLKFRVFKFFNNVFGASGVAADGEDEDRGGTNGLDDFLGPHGGAVDVGFVHPDGHALLAQVLNQLDDLLLVLPRVTDKNVRAHRCYFPLLIFSTNFL